MENGTQDFWSKPRNRWLVVLVSALSVFGGYVVATPGVKNPNDPSIIEQPTTDASSKLAQSGESSKTKRTSIEKSQTATDPKKSQPNKAKSKLKTAIDHLFHRSSEPDTFDPFSRDLSEKEKIALAKEIQRGPVKYPYEISKEELELAEKDAEGNATPADRIKMFGLVSGFRPKKPNDDKSSDDPSKKSEPEQSPSSGPRKSASSDSYFSGSGGGVSQADDQPTASADESNPDSDEVTYSQGKVVDGYSTPYASGAKTVPPGLEFTHKNLEIYNIVAGLNAGLAATVFNVNAIDNKEGSTKIGTRHYQKNLYNEISIDDKATFHRMYSVAPDWDNHWFADDLKKGNELSRAASIRHLITLGTGGSITFIVVDGKIIDKLGPDFVIWSNPFCYIDDPKQNMDEIPLHKDYLPNIQKAISGIEKNVKCSKKLARVEVSEHFNNDWVRVEPCDARGDDPRSKCAGYGINLWKENPGLLTSGGDKYDLSEAGVGSIRAIRITDMGNGGDFYRGGFALDAIAMVHFLGEITKNTKGK